MYAFALAVRERVDSAPDESGRTVWPGRDCALRFEDEDLPDDAAGAGISKIQLYVVSLFTRVWFSARGCSATWRCRVRASQTFPFPRRKSSRSGCCGSSTAASREHQLSKGFWLSFCVSAGGRQNCRARQQRECVHLREHTGPVSYTHLDVYKRQELYKKPSKILYIDSVKFFINRFSSFRILSALQRRSDMI